MYNRWLSPDELMHHGVKDQQWGVRNGPPYPLDRSKSDGHRLLTKGDGSPQGKKKRKKKTVFVSGSSKTQDEASGYYRKELPKDIQKQLDDHIRKGNRIIVGDAPGIDRQVQDYLNSKKYRNVEVYGPGKEVRYTANSKWKTNPIDDPDHEPGSKEWLAKKDIAMTEAADEGLAIVLDEGAKATRKNVQRLSEGGKGVRVYSLNKDGNDNWEDDWDRKWNASYASKDVKKANDIYKTLSKQEKYFLTAEENSKRYVSREEYGKKGTNAYSLIEQYKDTPVSVIDIWKDDRGGADVSIAVRNDSKYRHKGYASRALENGLKYFYDHPEIEYLIWGVNSQNRPSIELAKKYGFYLYDKRDDGWETYTLDQKKEVKHAMAYNRWLAPDELMHHGVKDQKWGVKNGPPYPLSRQEKFRTVGPDGRPITSKKAYKKAMSVERAKKKQERAKHPNGTPEDHKERNSLVAKIKRGYRQYKNNAKAEREREEQERRDWLAAKKRLDSSDIPDDVKKKMLRDALGYDSDGPVNTGVAEKLWDNDTFSGDDTESQRLNKIIDAYGKKEKAKRDAAKEHGTAEEVMKYRDTFTADEWKGIAERLSQEKRVQDLLPKPSNDNNGKQEAAFVAYKFADKKTQQIYDHGRARDVFQNRDKFTPDQLNSIVVRLKAEEEIAKYANTQFNPQGKAGERLKKAADVLKTIAGVTGSMSSIAKNLGLTSNNGGGDGNKKK